MVYPLSVLIEILYYFLSKIHNEPILLTIIALLAGIGWYLESDYCFFDSSFLPWNLPSAFFALTFYYTGNKIAPYIKKFFIQSKSYFFVIVLLVCFTIDIPLALLNGHVTLGTRHLGNGFVFYITGIVGTIGILSLSCLLKEIKFFQWLGKNSFYMMATHKPFLLIYPILWSKVEKETNIPLYDKENIFECIIPFVITVSVCAFFTFVYVKLKIIIKKGTSKNERAS